MPSYIELGAGIAQIGDDGSYKLVRGRDVDLITNGTELTSGNLIGDDVFLVDDGAAGTSTKYIKASSLLAYINANISTGVSGDTFATDLKIGRDADNLIDFTTDDQITFRVAANNGVVMKASGEIEATSLDLPGLDYGTSTLTLSQTQTNNAILELKNSSTDASGSILKFMKDSSSPDQVDKLGVIQFYGNDAGGGLGSSIKFGEIRSLVVATSGTDYAGSMYFDVAKDGNTSNSGLAIKGKFAQNVIDIDLGYGATSLTTVAGKLNVGEVEIDNKTITITGDTGDTFAITTGAGGATTLTTTDAGVLGGDFEIDADGDITLDAAGNISIEPATNLNIAARGVNITSGASDSPSLSIKNNNDSADGPQLILSNERDGNGLEDNDNLGVIKFAGDDAGGNLLSSGYAEIRGVVAEADDGDECGKLQLHVANNGGLKNGITMTASSATAAEVDVSIANGADSATTIAGKLELGHSSDTTIARSAAGTVTIEDKEIVTINKVLQQFNLSFGDDIGTAEHYLSWRDQFETSTSNSYDIVDTNYLVPANGRVKCVYMRVGSRTATSTLTVKVYSQNAGFMQGQVEQEAEASSITSSDDFEVFAFYFDDAEHFQAGDSIKISVQDSVDSGSFQTYNVTAVLEFDYTQMGRTDTGELA